MPQEAIQLFTQAVLRGSEHGRIRRLGGFLKGSHHEPQAVNAATEAFVRKVSRPDLEERANNLYQQLRAAFAYKRRELDFRCDLGSAIVQSPDFTVALSIEQDPEEPRAWRLESEVSRFQRPEVILESPFLDLFQHHCDTVEIGFAHSIDIESRIDAIEESPQLAAHLEFPPDAAWLALRPPPPSPQMRLSPHAVSFTLPPGGDLKSLIEGAMQIIEFFAQAGSALQLEIGH